MLSFGCKVNTYANQSDLPVGWYLRLLRPDSQDLFIHLGEITMLGRDLCGARWVDSHHAVIKQEILKDQKILFVQDNSSDKGTFVNGMKLLEDEKKFLSQNDVIRLGHVDKDCSFVVKFNVSATKKNMNGQSSCQVMLVTETFESQETLFASQEDQDEPVRSDVETEDSGSEICSTTESYSSDTDSDVAFDLNDIHEGGAEIRTGIRKSPRLQKNNAKTSSKAAADMPSSVKCSNGSLPDVHVFQDSEVVLEKLSPFKRKQYKRIMRPPLSEGSSDEDSDTSGSKASSTSYQTMGRLENTNNRCSPSLSIQSSLETNCCLDCIVEEERHREICKSPSLLENVRISKGKMCGENAGMQEESLSLSLMNFSSSVDDSMGKTVGDNAETRQEVQLLESLDISVSQGRCENARPNIESQSLSLLNLSDSFNDTLCQTDSEFMDVRQDVHSPSLLDSPRTFPEARDKRETHVFPPDAQNAKTDNVPASNGLLTRDEDESEDIVCVFSSYEPPLHDVSHKATESVKPCSPKSPPIISLKSPSRSPTRTPSFSMAKSLSINTTNFQSVNTGVPHTISTTSLPSLITTNSTFSVNCHNISAKPPKSPSAKARKSLSAKPPKSLSAKPPKSLSAKPPKSLSTKPPKSPSTKPPKSPSTKPPKSPSTKPSKSPFAKPPKSPFAKPPKSPSAKPPKSPSAKPPKSPSVYPPKSPSIRSPALGSPRSRSRTFNVPPPNNKSITDFFLPTNEKPKLNDIKLSNVDQNSKSIIAIIKQEPKEEPKAGEKNYSQDVNRTSSYLNHNNNFEQSVGNPASVADEPKLTVHSNGIEIQGSRHLNTEITEIEKPQISNTTLNNRNYVGIDVCKSNDREVSSTAAGAPAKCFNSVLSSLSKETASDLIEKLATSASSVANVLTPTKTSHSAWDCMITNKAGPASEESSPPYVSQTSQYLRGILNKLSRKSFQDRLSQIDKPQNSPGISSSASRVPDTSVSHGSDNNNTSLLKHDSQLPNGAPVSFSNKQMDVSDAINYKKPLSSVSDIKDYGNKGSNEVSVIVNPKKPMDLSMKMNNPQPSRPEMINESNGTDEPEIILISTSVTPIGPATTSTVLPINPVPGCSTSSIPKASEPKVSGKRRAPEKKKKIYTKKMKLDMIKEKMGEDWSKYSDSYLKRWLPPTKKKRKKSGKKTEGKKQK